MSQKQQGQVLPAAGSGQYFVEKKESSTTSYCTTQELSLESTELLVNSLSLYVLVIFLAGSFQGHQSGIRVDLFHQCMLHFG